MVAPSNLHLMDHSRLRRMLVHGQSNFPQSAINPSSTLRRHLAVSNSPCRNMAATTCIRTIRRTLHMASQASPCITNVSTSHDAILLQGYNGWRLTSNDRQRRPTESLVLGRLDCSGFSRNSSISAAEHISFRPSQRINLYLSPYTFLTKQARF